MSKESDYKIQSMEEFFGDAEMVKRGLEVCDMCGSKLVMGHLTDFDHLLVKESAHCPDCGHQKRKYLHLVH